MDWKKSERNFLLAVVLFICSGCTLGTGDFMTSGRLGGPKGNGEGIVGAINLSEINAKCSTSSQGGKSKVHCTLAQNDKLLTEVPKNLGVPVSTITPIGGALTDLLLEVSGATYVWTFVPSLATKSVEIIFQFQDKVALSTKTQTLSLEIIQNPSLPFCTGTKLVGVVGGDTRGFGVTTDPKGNVFVVGRTSGSLAGQVLTGTDDLFVEKCPGSANDTPWTRQLGASGKFTEGRGILVDVNGDLVIAGSSTGSLPGAPLVGFSDALLVKYDSFGNRRWVKQIGVANQFTFGTGIAADSLGNYYLTGTTGGGLAGPLIGTTDVFLAKFDSNGNSLWMRQFGAAGVQTEGFSITVDSSGASIATGYTDGALNGVPKTGMRDAFIIKLDSSGNKQWEKLIGSVGSKTEAYSISVGSSGDVFVTGNTDGDLGGAPKVGSQDLWVARFDPNGIKSWVTQLGEIGASISGRGIVTNNLGQVFITGETDRSFNQQPLQGIKDAFLLKLGDDGQHQWTRQYGTAGNNAGGRGVAPDGFGGAYVVGISNGGMDSQPSIGTYDSFLLNINADGSKL